MDLANYRPFHIRILTNMNWHTYTLFIIASLILNLVPGPDMLFLLGRAVAQGRRSGLCAAFGINLGAYVHLAAAITGLSAILMTSATAFTVVKWIGAAYLVYLGIRTLQAGQSALHFQDENSAKRANHFIFWQGFLSDVLNPKVALFYLALLPQFLSADSRHPAQELLLLGITGNMVGISVSVTLVFASMAITMNLRRNETIASWLQKAMGAMFVGLGIKLVTEHR